MDFPDDLVCKIIKHLLIRNGRLDLEEDMQQEFRVAAWLLPAETPISLAIVICRRKVIDRFLSRAYRNSYRGAIMHLSFQSMDFLPKTQMGLPFVSPDWDWAVDADVETLLNNSGLSDSQRFDVEGRLLEFEDQVIANLRGVSRSAVSRSISKAIAKMNNFAKGEY